MAVQRRKEEAEAFNLATQQALICAPASPTKSSPQRITTLSSNDDTDCHPLRLSPEVRGRIYYYTMDNDFHASLDPISSRYPAVVKTRSRTPAVMRTCSQMRNEAGAIWYSGTIFIYRLDAILYKWLQLIGPDNQKLIRTVRRDSILVSKRWAEAYIAFTHSRLRDQKLFLAEDAIEVAFWEPAAALPVKAELEQSSTSTVLVAAANAALERVVDNNDIDEPEADDMLLEDDHFPDGAFEFDPDLELSNFAEKFLDHVQSDDVTATGDDNVSSAADSKSSTTSVAANADSSKYADGNHKKKSKKSAKSSASSVVDSVTSTKESDKKEKNEKRKTEKQKSSPSSLAGSVMSTKSGKGEPKIKKPVKPKVKKEPEPEKTWAFVRMETVKF